MVIAYEPVWAIGTGNNATPRDVERAVGAIRSHVSHLFGTETSKQVRVLYGGSVNVDNAASYLAAKGVDGLLVGGASLDVHAFSEIIKKAQKSDASPVKRKN